MNKEELDYAIKLCEEAGVCLEDGNTHGAAFALGSLAHLLISARAEEQGLSKTLHDTAFRKKIRQLQEEIREKPVDPSSNEYKQGPLRICTRCGHRTMDTSGFCPRH